MGRSLDFLLFAGRSSRRGEPIKRKLRKQNRSSPDLFPDDPSPLSGSLLVHPFTTFLQVNAVIGPYTALTFELGMRLKDSFQENFPRE
jgi:hypothetical protein